MDKPTFIASTIIAAVVVILLGIFQSFLGALLSFFSILLIGGTIGIAQLEKKAGYSTQYGMGFLPLKDAMRVLFYPQCRVVTPALL